VDKLTPSTTKRKKHCLYTLGFILAVWAQLDLEKPLDAAMFACLTMCFYASVRLGKFTAQTLNSFGLTTHVTSQHLSYNQDHNSFKMMILYIPRTKMTRAKGKDMY
jgi:hypothetical protein